MTDCKLTAGAACDSKFAPATYVDACRNEHDVPGKARFTQAHGGRERASSTQCKI
jgi:hypothetical protein